ncbi:MAG: hypothetical protein C5B52_07830 [Bacteroidetes bacterium]|nr:MAG: hypothetical protein C5B52_07830 [Bacteroidota bacterium]
MKDHLGNVRMVLTEESQTDMYPPLTMEAGIRSSEQTYYSPNPLSTIESPKPSGFDSDTSNHTVVRLNYTDAARRIGPSILLKVMATDTVDIKTDVFYKSAGQNNNNNHIISEMVAGLIAAFGGTSSAMDPTGHYTIGDRNTTTFNSSGYPGIDNLKNGDPNLNAGKPKAYMNWILFDEQFNMVSSSSGTRQINSNADTKGTMAELGKIMSTNGYLYVYLSNESPMDVYFENFQVTHHRGRILDENHYYLFGLPIAGLSSRALKTGYIPNRFLFISKEFQIKEFSDGSELSLFDFGSRFYDAQIGRWGAIDPNCEKMDRFSPFNYGFDNPIRFLDPDGKEPVPLPTPKLDETPSDPTGMDKQEGRLNSDDFMYHSTVQDASQATLNNGVQGPKDPPKKDKKNQPSDNGKTDPEKFLDYLATVAGYFAIPADALKELGGFDKAMKLLKSGKFIANFNGVDRVWNITFMGNKSVSASFVAVAKKDFEFLAKGNGIIFKGAKMASLTFGWIGAGIATAKVIKDPTGDNIKDAVFSYATFIPGIGWYISDGYSVMKELGIQKFFQDTFREYRESNKQEHCSFCNLPH